MTAFDYNGQTITEYEYYINLDERGEFYADVRLDGQTVFEINGFDIFEDGFMDNAKDIAGLMVYLKDLGIIPAASFPYGSSLVLAN